MNKPAPKALKIHYSNLPPRLGWVYFFWLCFLTNYIFFGNNQVANGVLAGLFTVVLCSWLFDLAGSKLINIFEAVDDSTPKS